MRVNFMRNGGVLERNRHHLGSRSFTTFANSISDFSGFTKPNADLAALIPYHHQGTKVEPTSTFYNLCGTINEDNFFNQILIFAVEFLVFSRSGATTAPGPPAPVLAPPPWATGAISPAATRATTGPAPTP